MVRYHWVQTARNAPPSLARLGIEHAPASYQSDSLWSYEIGSKNEFLDTRAVLNAAVFHTDWKKIQQSINLSSCAMQFVGNIGAAKVDGADCQRRFPSCATFERVARWPIPKRR